MKPLLSILTVVIVAVLAFVGYRFTQPGGIFGYKYESVTSVQIHPSMLTNSPVRRSDKTKSSAAVTTVRYIENEFETIVSPEVLQAAITAADLHIRWNVSLEEATTRIKPMVEARPRRGTNFIDIVGRSQNQEDAKLISQGVADAYIEHRNDIEKTRAEHALATLNEELQPQADLVQEKRTALTVLIQNNAIPHFEGRSPSPNGLTEEEMLRKTTSKLDTLELDRDQLQIKLKKLTTVEDDELIRVAAGFELPESQVSRLYTQWIEATKQREAMITNGLGTVHPSVKALDQKIITLKNEADQAVVTLMDVLRTRLTLVNNRIEKMKEMVSGKQSKPVELTMQQEKYNLAKEEYEQARDLYKEMKLQQQEQRVFLKMPRTPVTLHEAAK